MCMAFKWLIQDAQHYTVRDVVGIQTLFEANRKEVDKETNMPFDSWMDITTIKRYVKVWKQLLLFVFQAEDDEAEFQPPYVLTDAQQSAMQTEKNAAGEDGDEDEGFDDGEDDKGMEGVEGAAEEVDEGFEDEMLEETKWMR
ncbi:hypothetical protein V498_04361 [Pseudogymnoascus sp. VKM F-4517 (FW-2822)]|nr:hypothetical protein V498_04361 [Pseudogymnoascus sp. VKM F-4517 (FW-2822)]